MTDQIDTLKREAKKLSRATSITHMQALDVLAAQRGYGHWGALADHIRRIPQAIERDVATAAADGHTPRVLLEHLLGMPLPHLAGCRHVLISGATSTGKTTLLSRLVAAVPTDRRIVAIEDTREIRLPAGSTSITQSRTDMARTDREAVAQALSNRPDLLLVGEISTTIAMPLLEAMVRPDGPFVATTIHASDARDAAVVFALRVAHSGRGRLPADVAIVHVERNADGARRVTEVTRSR